MTPGMMTSLYILRMKMKERDEFPLLSVRDVRLLVIATPFGTQKEPDSRMRQRDMDRCLKNLLW